MDFFLSKVANLERPEVGGLGLHRLLGERSRPAEGADSEGAGLLDRRQVPLTGEAVVTERRHRCPGVDGDAASALARVLHRNDWITSALHAVVRSGLPDAWIGAGAVRDVVWGERYGRFDPADVRDVDVAYFDPADLSRERDAAAQRALTDLADLRWEATNQAAVHTWYQEYFGGPPVEAFRSVHDAVATWPETATCVAVRLASTRPGLDVCAPHGLDDLLDGVWRVNPVRVTPDVSAARLARQRVEVRWPRVTIVPPG